MTKDNTSAELKACPFCRSADIISKTDGEYVLAECLDCGAEHDLKMWNRRPAQSQQPERVTGLVEALALAVELLKSAGISNTEIFEQALEKYKEQGKCP